MSCFSFYCLRNVPRNYALLGVHSKDSAWAHVPGMRAQGTPGRRPAWEACTPERCALGIQALLGPCARDARSWEARTCRRCACASGHARVWDLLIREARSSTPNCTLLDAHPWARSPEWAHLDSCSGWLFFFFLMPTISCAILALNEAGYSVTSQTTKMKMTYKATYTSYFTQMPKNSE